MRLDLASFSSIRDFVNSLTKSHGRVDILVNNAGVACMLVFFKEISVLMEDYVSKRERETVIFLQRPQGEGNPPPPNGHGYHRAWSISAKKLILTSLNFWNIIQNLYFSGNLVEIIIIVRNMF